MFRSESDLAGCRILIVDDNPLNLNLLQAILQDEGYIVESEPDGSGAISRIATQRPDLILLDIMMPEMSGFDVCQILKNREDTASIPIIFLSALSNIRDKLKAFDSGGVDYITKPFEVSEVLIRVRTQLFLQRAQAQVEQLNRSLEARVQQRTLELQQLNQKLATEVDERRRTQDKLVYQACHDDLTGLPNRAALMAELARYMRVTPDHWRPFTVLFLDCDRFKFVNDSYGHLVGDQLLVEVAQRLQATARPIDLVARLGGDEFMVLLPGVDNTRSALTIAQRFHEALHQPIRLAQREFVLGASIGIVVAHPGYHTPEMVVRDADIAMYQAKAQGRSGSCCFTPEMYAQVRHTLELETDLRQAIAQEQLQLHYQPIVTMADQQIAGFEALVRWVHPSRGMISPAQFIPLAEETGLIIPLGRWVLQSACQQLQAWRQQGLVSATTQMSVNVSPEQLMAENFVQDVEAVLRDTQLSPHLLKLEITESVMLEPGKQGEGILRALKARSLQLSLDDFGTGYSALSCLHQFPLDSVKIDRSFVQRIGDQGEHLAMVQAIVSMADHLGLSVIAEGVETSHQLQFLRETGCTYGQGYWYAKPMAADVLTPQLATLTAQWQASLQPPVVVP